MTYKKSTQSLERLCLKLLSKNINQLQNDAQHLSPILRNKLYENREKLIKKYPRSVYDIKNVLRMLPWKVFITPGTKKLEELIQFQLSIFEIHPKILNVCHNLRHLDVSNMQFGKRILKQLVINNRKLETIDFEDTFCSNSVLQAIGKYCRNLKRLNISQCRNFNDNGINDLCNEHMKIIHLNVLTTKITTNGFLFALNNLPCLTTICYDQVLNVIKVPQYQNRLLSKSIQDFESYVVIEDDDQLQPLSVAFPNSSTIDIEITEIDEILYPIDYFPQLKQLEIRIGLIDKYSYFGLLARLNVQDKFREQIRPAFHSVNNLTHLSLWGIPSVDLVVIGRSCPRLKNFVVFLDGTTDCASLNEPCPHVLFENLERLSIVNNFQRARKEFELLLSNCSRLKELSVDSSLVFSNDLLRWLLKSNQMKCLESFFLEQCPGITTKFLKRLMKMDNRLRILSVIRCKNVNESDLAKFADEKCFDIEIKFIQET